MRNKMKITKTLQQQQQTPMMHA